MLVHILVAAPGSVDQLIILEPIVEGKGKTISGVGSLALNICIIDPANQLICQTIAQITVARFGVRRNVVFSFGYVRITQSIPKTRSYLVIPSELETERGISAFVPGKT